MKSIKYFLLAAGAITMLSCSKLPPNSEILMEDLVVLTQYDENTSFGDYKTYYISDSITYNTDDDSKRIINSKTTALVDRISQDMTSRGFHRVIQPSDSIDLVFTVSLFEVTKQEDYYPGWWWAYSAYIPWVGYGFSYYYPYYPATYTSYTAGTVIIELANLRKPNSDNLYPLVWTAYLRGLMTGDHTTDDVTWCVDQAFEQTPAIVTTR